MRPILIIAGLMCAAAATAQNKPKPPLTAEQILVCSSGGSVAPTPVSLPVLSVDAWEAYEGMLVTFPQALVISEYFDYDRFGEIVLTSERHTTSTSLFEPGSPESLASAVLRLAAEPALLSTFRREAARTIEGYTVSRMADAYEDAYAAAQFVSNRRTRSHYLLRGSNQSSGPLRDSRTP